MNKGTRTILYFLILIAGALLIIFTSMIIAGASLMVIAFLLSVIDGDSP